MSRTAYELTRPADYLQRLADSGIGRSYKRLAVELLAIAPGDTVLDVGCGPGADLERFSEAVGPRGQVIGIDNDPAAIAEAGARTASLGNVRAVCSDAHSTPLAADCVDHAHTDRMLQHVCDPAAVIAEVARVLRPGGRFVAAEPDWDTLIISGDLDVSHAFRRFVIEQAVRNAYVGRELPGLLTGTGFEVIDVLPVTAVFREVTAADQVLGLARVTERAITAGYLAAGPGRAWLDRHSEGEFFASMTLFIVVAAHPGRHDRRTAATGTT